jgi:hypothetical protein
MRLRPWLVAALLSFATPGLVFAQAPDVRATADDLFKQGREAMSRKDFKHALRLLRESHAADPGRGKLLNIALCEEELGLVASALHDFEEVLPQLEGDQRAAMVKEHVDKVGPRVPRIRILLAPGAPAGTTVTLDGAVVEAAKLGTEVLVDPGKHEVKAVAQGAKERTYEVVVEEGAQSIVSVEPERVEVMTPVPQPPVPPPVAPLPEVIVPPAPIAPAADTRPGRGTRWKLGVGAVGVGGASTVVGAVTGVLALNDHATLESNCASGVPCDAAKQVSLHSDMMNLAHTSTATFVAGAALAGTGVVLIATSPSDRDGSAGWLGPVVRPGFVGVLGRF